MIKKLLLLLIVTFYFSAFAQQNNETPFDKSTSLIVKNIVASPNPFTVTTKVKFFAGAKFNVGFSVKDLIGNVVYRKKYTTKKGTNYIPFYKGKLDSGVYIYSIKTRKEIISKRIVIK